MRVPSGDGREITLLDLATQTSGLPRLPDNLAPKDMTNPYADYDVAYLYAFLSSYSLPREPGEACEYSNLGMGLLGHALALRAGMPDEQLAVLSPPSGPLGAAIASAIVPRHNAGQQGLDVGLGWHILEHARGRIVWHNGQTGGYHAFIGVIPDNGANVVVLTNTGSDIDDIGLHLLDASIPLR